MCDRHINQLGSGFLDYHGIGKKLSDILPNNLSLALTTLDRSSSFFFLPPPPRKVESSESDPDESESNIVNLSSSDFSMAANSSVMTSRMSL
mmetsp:Transcript_3963/g.7665  ORF Transcript_3963/g.7665 Transcript_3963/m.7665 type:complete len:92 (-) Transcript_3963:1101-1376(-)